MVIRCERCSTMYELDESLLAPEGSPVQCTRCQHVFTAFPPASGEPASASLPDRPAGVDVSRGGGRTPRRSEASAAEARRPDPEKASEGSSRPRVQGAPAPASADGTPEEEAVPAPPRRTRAARAPWNGVPAVYRPASASVGKPPGFARDSVSAVEARLRSTARLKWLAPLVALGVVLLGALAFYLASNRGDPDARRARAEAVALLLLDDEASLERAVVRLTEALRRSPGGLGADAVADRALALVLRASAMVPGDGALSPEPGAQDDGGRGVPERERARQEQARALARSAFEALRAAQADAGDTPEIARALAIHHAVRGERDRAAAVLGAARRRGVKDAWLDLAEAWLDAGDPDRAARERAAARLGALAAARPEILRGRYLLARTQASLGRRSEAAATLDALLAENPRHEAAKKLRDELASAAAHGPEQEGRAAQAPGAPPAAAQRQGQADRAAPAPPPPDAAAMEQHKPVERPAQAVTNPTPPAGEPGAVKPATQPRKRIAHPGEGTGADGAQGASEAGAPRAAPAAPPADPEPKDGPPRAEPAAAPELPAPPIPVETPKSRHRSLEEATIPPELLGGG